jgi:hypothetical protein
VIRLAADENVRRKIVRGVLRREPHLDIVYVQEIGLAGACDAAILEWAAGEGRILLTHDVSTMTRYAYERLAGGEPMVGVWEVKSRAPIGRVIGDIVLLLNCSEEGEWDGQVLYLPL